ncbi:MAG: ChbG/HpnK family deacetylase [Candidatus Omnitrophica bacterium]|nr:ChbG/HpnK family deacetylase [Candidatus Omnitrophota bacterium]
MAKKLLIVADDFGVSDDINQGIVECMTRGALSGTSILAVGSAFDDAVSRARAIPLPAIGVHLALTGGFKPVVGLGTATNLVSGEGLFPDSFPGLWARLTLKRIDARDIYRELKSQIIKVKRAGFRVTRIDSHQHIHMMIPIAKIVLQLMKEEGITYIRYPREAVPWTAVLREPVNALRYRVLRGACKEVWPFIQEAGVSYSGNFVGQFHAHRLTKQDFFRAVEKLPEGVTEIGCHPGFFGGHIRKARPWYRRCEEELKALCDTGLRRRIEKSGAALVREF